MDSATKPLGGPRRLLPHLRMPGRRAFMPWPLRVPARLLHARGKTTAAQHVAARHLDHAFERVAAAHLPLVAAAPLVDALRASPEPLALPNLARRLQLRLHRRGPLHFLRLFPRVFRLRAPLPLSLSLTPTVVDLSAELTRRVEGRQRGQGEGRRRGG